MQRASPEDQLVSLVVHELRTPVAIIRAYAQLLEAQLECRPERVAPTGSHEIATHILEQAELMTSWMEAMLEVRRVHLNQLPLDCGPVDLVRLVWTVAEELQQTSPRHRIRVLVSRNVPHPVLGDRARLRQVLTNLVDNAVRYTAAGAIQVRVGMKRKSGQALVAVDDSGPGLSPSKLGGMFAAYEQGESRGAGLGLGLYLSRQIARLHGGDLRARCHGPLNGTTFILALPVATCA